MQRRHVLQSASGGRLAGIDFLNAGWQKREDTSGLLEEVLSLTHAPRKVLPFAKKWGPLWVCCDDWHMKEYG